MGFFYNFQILKDFQCFASFSDTLISTFGFIYKIFNSPTFFDISKCGVEITIMRTYQNRLSYIAILFFTFFLSFHSFGHPEGLDLESILKFKAAIQLLAHEGALKERSTAKVQSSIKTTLGKFDFFKVALHHEKLGEIRLLLKGPTGFVDSSKRTRLPTLFLTSGFTVGAAGVQLMGDNNDLIVIGFDYPYSLKDFELDPQKMFDFIHRTPLQIAASLQWVSEQSWMSDSGLVAMGVSLGGLFLPSALHLTESLGTKIQGTVLAYTGAHLPPVLHEMLKKQIPKPVLDEGIKIINNLTSIIDPKLHLPFLTGRFLAIRASNDQLFPLESSLLLENLLPSPKSFKIIAGPHIDVDQPSLIFQTQQLVQEWLESQVQHN